MKCCRADWALKPYKFMVGSRTGQKGQNISVTQPCVEIIYLTD